MDSLKRDTGTKGGQAYITNQRGFQNNIQWLRLKLSLSL